MKVVGEKPIMPFLADIDNIKMGKVYILFLLIQPHFNENFRMNIFLKNQS